MEVERPGMAKVKKEYIIQPASTVKKLTRDVEADGAPPKKKRRGQNKHRPQTKRNEIEARLCPSLVSESGICTFGQNCRFIHDIGRYISQKPEDVGPKCHAFETHGKCNFGFACRYGSSHIRKTEEGEYENVTDQVTLASHPPPVIANTLPREFLLSLRKKKFKFTKSENLLKAISGAENGKAENITIKECSPDSTAGSQNDVVHKVTCGAVMDEDLIKPRMNEKKTLDFKNMLYLAPLTTLGNLPFRVTCKSLGAEVTCGEMTMATSLLQGNVSEWALLKRHPCEKTFGVQICGGYPDTMAKCAELINSKCDVDFVDINMGCPIDLVYNKGAGSALMRRTNKLFDIVDSVNGILDVPLTCKMRAGIESKRSIAHEILPKLRDHGIALSCVHGRSRQARYTKQADWDYIEGCAKAAAPMPLFGNGDVLSFEDYNSAVSRTDIAGVMIARGALIKPWIFTEIKEQRHWDISSSERLDILRKFTNTGLLHWGSDTRGVETTRKFLLEWLSFLHRYIPVGVLERIPQRINEQPPPYVARDDLETLMASSNCKSWVHISEMLLGKVPDEFQFLPKHKANSYS